MLPPKQECEKGSPQSRPSGELHHLHARLSGLCLFIGGEPGSFGLAQVNGSHVTVLSGGRNGEVLRDRWDDDRAAAVAPRRAAASRAAPSLRLLRVKGVGAAPEGAEQPDAARAKTSLSLGAFFSEQQDAAGEL